MKKRYSARQLRIGDLLRANEVVSTNPITDEENRYVVLDKQVLHRIRICGSVISTREGVSSNNTNFLVADVDDSSGVVPIFIFGMAELQNEVRTGEIIDVVGRPRVYNDSISVTVETLKTVDIAHEIYHRINLLENDVSTVGMNSEATIPDYVSLKEFEENQRKTSETDKNSAAKGRTEDADDVTDSDPLGF